MGPIMKFDLSRVEGSESHADMQRQAEGTGRAEALG